MNSLDLPLDQPEEWENRESTILVPMALGLGVDLLSLVIGEPYTMAALGLVVGLAATLAWSEKPLAWIVFTAVIAANPANTTTPIALNLFCASMFFVLMRGAAWKSLPRLAQAALFFAMLSTVISVVVLLPTQASTLTIHATDVSRPWMATWIGGASLETLISQGVALVNYLLGPFLLIPLVFSRIRGEHDPEVLLKGLVFGLIMPTLLFFLLARIFGQPVIDANSLSENLLNVSTFHLGKLDIQMIRTQVGIILAALICASFAVTISQVQRATRIMAAGCLGAAAYLLLVTGSVGSTLSALAGITLILMLGKRQFSFKRYMMMLSVGIGLGLVAWVFLPKGVQKYAESRYEVRVSKSGSPTDDRSWRWKKSFNYLMENPSGVGWSLYVEPLGIYPHNDYLSYGIAYGILCGLVYFLDVSGLLFLFVSISTAPLNSSRFALALVGAGTLTVVLINSLSDHLTSNRWYFNVVWSLIWYAFFASRVESRSADSTNP
jgi:hypothetical protein